MSARDYAYRGERSLTAHLVELTKCPRVERSDFRTKAALLPSLFHKHMKMVLQNKWIFRPLPLGGERACMNITTQVHDPTAHLVELT